jgi:fatty acid synthase subunit alpha, fungi type
VSSILSNATRRLIILRRHQFCFPVRWIETQDLILGSRKTERIVEIGPTSTLANMAKRTLDLKYRSKDTAQNVSRQLLAFQRDLDTILYEEKPLAPPVKDEAQALEPSAPAKHPPPQHTTTQAPPAPALPLSTVEVVDAPVNAVDVATTIIAAGMKKSVDGQMGKSLKALAGGRSTLQNEILGDIAAEFGSTPDGAEDLPLEKLCANLQGSFNGQLGKKTLSLVQKLLSTKFPGSFQISGTRKYLKERWGLGPGRQDSVVLCTITAQPESRLKTEDEARVFLDGVAQAYFARAGIALPTCGNNTQSGGEGSAMVDPKALDFLEEKQRSVFQQQLQIYARELGVDLHANEKTVASLKERIAELENQVDHWNAEHGEVYESGIRPMFSPLKARTYDSWWNWAVQDLLVLVNEIKSEKKPPNDAEIKDLKRRLVTRSQPRLLETMRFLASQTSSAKLKHVLNELIVECESSLQTPPAILRNPISMAPVTTIDESGKISYSEEPRSNTTGTIFNTDSSLRLGRKGPSGWDFDETLSKTYISALEKSVSSGFSFENKVVLITGAGARSIGAEILHGLLAAGAYVIVTSSSYSPKVTRAYQDLYSRFGARGSRLVLVPFNQSSQQDVEALVSFVYNKNGLDTDLDFVIPFAAISESGREVDNVDSRSELAHRLMLTNVLRLLGGIKKQKASLGITTRPAQVILPLSPNHGTFGNDGLYSESKLGLESLFEKWHSESWGDYLAICGAIIGWTRGTALMTDNDIISQEMENLGMRTYSQEEMAYNILALMSTSIVPLSMFEPLLADLSGGMGSVARLKEITVHIRQSINKASQERRAIMKEASFDKSAISQDRLSEQQANVEFNFPKIPDYDTQVKPLSKQLQGMVDLESVVVIAGFAEIGPWGNSRTRWEMEARGEISVEACLELAWMMGLIKSHSGMLNGEPYCGWLDKETGKPISDKGIKCKYEQHILSHCGIRRMELNGTEWDTKEVLHEVEVQRDHEPFETSEKVAFELKKAHGDKVDIIEMPDSGGEFKVTLKKGARIMVPKSIASTSIVGGQIPKGWDARTYGIPDDIVSQVDRATLYPLISTAEALHSAGILNPYELYNYIHVSELGNCVGSGCGGATSFQKIHRDRYRDQSIPNDTLAESFINSGSAWINMLLLSASGPIKTPVGACATAVESLDTGFDLIASGKAKAVLVGGYDDMIEAIADEFANLKATMNPADDMARGRDPKEMSRPATSTRKGFVEAEGAGVQLITSAKLALDMGLPIYGLVAHTQTASDKTGRSLPAPGKGLLVNARQTKSKFDSPLMSLPYRKRLLEMRRTQIRESQELELAYLEEELDMLNNDDSFDREEYRTQRVKDIKLDASRQEQQALKIYGNQFWHQDSRIAPIRGALAVWGLTVDDLNVASFHGTSTVANEKNESLIIQTELAHLGRKKGNVLPCVFQKHLTGHPKGAAGAWMLNGCLQMLDTGLIPGNRNGDNIDKNLEQYDYLVFPNKTIATDEIKAFSVTSFGFGQKGSQIIGIHPKFLFATIEEGTFREYEKKVQVRHKKAFRKFHEGMANNTLFVARDKPPYEASKEMEFLLNPESRLSIVI